MINKIILKWDDLSSHCKAFYFGKKLSGRGIFSKMFPHRLEKFIQKHHGRLFYIQRMNFFLTVQTFKIILMKSRFYCRFYDLKYYQKVDYLSRAKPSPFFLKMINLLPHHNLKKLCKIFHYPYPSIPLRTP